MAKKSTSPSSNAQGGLKKGKIKRKQMFNELQTVQEQKVNQNIAQDDELIEDQGMVKIQQEDDIKMQKIQIGQQKSLQEVCQAVNQLMAKNKIGAKNAFDVPIIDLFELINFRKTENQNTWKTLSSTFQNDSKIYAYRVDAIHEIAYSILNIMSRRSTQTQQKLKPQLQKGLQKNIHTAQFADLKDSFLANVETQKTFLQTDSSKINISMIECNMTSDPNLQRTKRQFDEPGLKGMLLNSISINKNLELLLFSQDRHESYSLKLSELNEIDTKSIEHPLKVFDSIEKIKTDVNKILGGGDQKALTNKELQQIWNNVKKGHFSDWGEGGQKVWLDVQDPECRENFDMMIDENSQNHALFGNTHRKFIGDFIKLKNPPKKMMTDQQMMQDGEKWMNEIDKRFLGLKTGPNAPKMQPTLKKPIRSFDDVNFEDFQIYQRDEILRKQSPTKQINEDIEDRFLTTIRPSNEFKIQKILTLREQPQIELQVIEQQMAIQHDQDHFLQRQIDIKRQMTSIKQIKQTIYDDLQTQTHTSFGDVYQGYCKRQGQISPALCFLTVLHLANEQNLSFESINGEMDFLIKLPGS